VFENAFSDIFAKKLGLEYLPKPSKEQLRDNTDKGGGGGGSLLVRLFNLMQRSKTDFTMLFRKLAFLDPSKTGDVYKGLGDLPNDFASILLGEEIDDKQIPEATSLWIRWINDYLDEVRHQRGQHQRGQHHSDTHSDSFVQEWRKALLQNNPRLVLRNYAAQRAIMEAENGNYHALQTLYAAIQTPFALSVDEAALLHGAEGHGSEGCSEIKLDRTADENVAEFEDPAPQWAKKQPGIAQLS